MAPGPSSYRSISRSVGLAAFVLYSLFAIASLLIRGGSGSTVGLSLGVLVILVGMIPMVRGVFASLEIHGDSLTVRGPLRTTRLSLSEVEGFSLGRYKILGCVCLVHRKGGSNIPVFAIQGITNQPRRRASVQARETVAELNARFQRADSVGARR